MVRSLLARLRNHFDLAVAEVDDQDRWQVATLGMACVSSSAIVADEVLSHALDYIEELRLDAMVIQVAKEITHML